MTRFHQFNPKPPSASPLPALPGSERLPAIKDDPSIVAGHAVKAAFTAKVTALRANVDQSESWKARQIAAAWAEATAELARRRADFDGRRQARWDAVQAQIPTGPDIPADTGPADRAVLLAAFQGAVDRARMADATELGRMYSDARRFGDDLTERAIGVVALGEGRGTMAGHYTANHPEIAAAVAELDELRAPTGRGFITQALGLGPLGQFPEPPEVAQAAAFERPHTSPLPAA
jgi:hypothetical protein